MTPSPGLAWLVPTSWLAVMAAIMLSGCAPEPKPATSIEPGFSAFCAAYPGRGTCP